MVPSGNAQHTRLPPFAGGPAEHVGPRSPQHPAGNRGLQWTCCASAPTLRDAPPGNRSMLLFVVAVTLSLLFSFVCSISEATLLSVGPARVEALAQTGSRLGKLLQRYRKDPARPIAAILIVNTISNSGGAALATVQFAGAFPGVSEAWFAAVFVITVLAVTEIVPR